MTQLSSKRRERRRRLYSLLLLEVRLLGGRVNRNEPKSPNSNNINNLREYIAELRGKLNERTT